MRIVSVISLCILLLACSTSRDNIFVRWWNGDPMWVTYSKEELKRRECDKKQIIYQGEHQQSWNLQ